MTDLPDELSLSLDEILAAARRLAVEDTHEQSAAGRRDGTTTEPPEPSSPTSESTSIPEKQSRADDASTQGFRPTASQPGIAPVGEPSSKKSSFDFVLDPDILASMLFAVEDASAVSNEHDEKHELQQTTPSMTSRPADVPSSVPAGIQPQRQGPPSAAMTGIVSEEPLYTVLNDAYDEEVSLPLTRREKRAAKRAAEVAAGKREPGDLNTDAFGPHAIADIGTDPGATCPDSGAEHKGSSAERHERSRSNRTEDDAGAPEQACEVGASGVSGDNRSHRAGELAMQPEVRSWEQAGVQRAALEFLKNSRREQAKNGTKGNESQPDSSAAGLTQPIKLNPVEATSAVTEARKGETEQKTPPATSQLPDQPRQGITPVADGSAVDNEIALNSQTKDTKSIPIGSTLDDAGRAWIDAGRPEWTAVPTVKPRKAKKNHELDDEPAHEVRRTHSVKGKSLKRERPSAEDQFHDVLHNGSSLSAAELDAGVASSIEDRMRQARNSKRKKVRHRIIAVAFVCVIGVGIGVGVGVGYLPITVENGQVVFGDHTFVLGEKTSSTSPKNPASSGTPGSGGTSGSEATGKTQDRSGEVIYSYTLTDPEGRPYAVTETVLFGTEGLCGHSTSAATFSSPEAATRYFETVKRDYGKSFVEGSTEGPKATVTVDVTSSKLDREHYEDALRNTVADLMIVKKS